MGLDWFRDYAPRDKQKSCSRRSSTSPPSTGKPAVIHTRAADADTLAALASFGGRVVLHCFSSPHLLEPALERGWYVSFAGNASTRKRSTSPRRTRGAGRSDPRRDRRAVPRPAADARRPNEPAYVMHTLAALAQARDEDPEELEQQIDRNATECFGL